MKYEPSGGCCVTVLVLVALSIFSIRFRLFIQAILCMYQNSSACAAARSSSGAAFMISREADHCRRCAALGSDMIARERIM